MSALLVACGDEFQPDTGLKSVSSESGLERPPGDPIDSEPDPSTPVEPPLKLCSGLSFTGVSWPSAFSRRDQFRMMVVLNISGSFEGDEGWRNLTNNFDGMGLSMGLLNQTLGTASLQPLLLRLRESRPDLIKQILGNTRAASLTAMLDKWKSQGGSALRKLSEMNPTSSPLDEDWVGPNGMGGELGLFALKEDQSVAWAVRTLYDSRGSFWPEWSQGLKNLSGHSDYVSLQVLAAVRNYNLALSYMNRMKFTDLRSFALFFDIVVQNGGLNDAEVSYLNDLVQRQPNLSTTDRLKALLEKRLLRTKTRWREDVRRRKTALIEGQGRVHGRNRNFPRELCMQPDEWTKP